MRLLDRHVPTVWQNILFWSIGLFSGTFLAAHSDNKFVEEALSDRWSAITEANQLRSTCIFTEKVMDGDHGGEWKPDLSGPTSQAK